MTEEQPSARPPAVSPSDVHALAAFLALHRSLVLTGAGISTDSGIPDYRGVNRRAPAPKPMTYQEFVRGEDARRRYWSRSAVGWAHMAQRAPNAGHAAVARLESLGRLTGVVTQNVDGLHRSAGTRELIELHGDLALVVCLDCGAREGRREYQRRLLAANPGFVPDAVPLLPDGDAAVDPEVARAFAVPVCAVCGGVMKPDVIFFGENVPKARLERAWDRLAAADGLVVLGSSLEVFSGYRFVRAAHTQGKPIAVVNHGPTRADGEVDLRLEARIADVLPAAVAELESALPT
jgi:NAD-dependent SIR2 family protein deacetylase